MAFTNDENEIEYHDKYAVVYDSSNVDCDTALGELTTLLSDLQEAGLHTEVRAGYGQTLLIFVQAPRTLLKKTVYRSRVKDWLFGVTKQYPGIIADSTVDGSFEAEDLLSVFHLVNWRKDLGGADITPEYGSWENVTAIYPLHNVAVNKTLLRRLSKKLFLDAEDLDCIRDLWGSKVAFYFAFIQTYFIFLIFPCVAGGLAWMFLPKYSLGFAILIGIWCTIFLEYWKIQELDLAIRWNVRGVGSLKVNRPQYQYEKEAVDGTGRIQQYFPNWKQVARQLAVVPFVLLSTLLLGVLITGLFAIEIFITETYDGPYRFYLEYLPTVLLAILLPYISNILEDIASKLTEYENHRTQDHYDMSLTQKIFVLSFITNYLPILLSAFVYVPFGHILVPWLRTILYRSIGKSTSNPFHFDTDSDRLRNEVIALTVTGQVSSFVEELIVPHLKTLFKDWWRDHNTKERDLRSMLYESPSEKKFLGRARKQATLPSYNVHEDILEMVIQFGYLALFSPVWPLIPIGFFINNWIELRSDFIKICIEHQRPAPVRGDGIGPWIYSLEFLTWLGSLTSAAIVHLFGTHRFALGFMENKFGKWCSLPITVFVSEHLFLAFRAGVKSVLYKVGSKQIRKDRNEQYVERKRYLDEMEKEATSSDIDSPKVKRRKSVRFASNDADTFWTTQVEDGSSIKVCAAIIRALKKDQEQAKDVGQAKKHR